MSFKLKSEVVLYEFSSTERNIQMEKVGHVVLSREKKLHNGWVVKLKGKEEADVEGKSLRDAEGKLRIIDNDTLGLSWRTDLPGCMRMFFPKPFNTWSSEEIIRPEEPIVDLNGTRHQRVESFPEVFTLFDRLNSQKLIEKRLEDVRGNYDVRWETKLIYEPSLPPQSRK
ncbi:MAG TPA: hypothetical protein VF185_03615 [Patescibacteria group bacterium]